jgi:hypothetical protein
VVLDNAFSVQIAKSDFRSAIPRVFLAYGFILVTMYYSIVSDRLLENALKYHGKLARALSFRGSLISRITCCAL